MSNKSTNIPASEDGSLRCAVAPGSGFESLLDNWRHRFAVAEEEHRTAYYTPEIWKAKGVADATERCIRELMEQLRWINDQGKRVPRDMDDRPNRSPFRTSA